MGLMMENNLDKLTVPSKVNLMDSYLASKSDHCLDKLKVKVLVYCLV